MSNPKPLLQALAGGVVRPPPVWLMRQAGRYLPEYRKLRQRARNFLEFCYTPELAVEATLQPLRRYELDAAILFSDILVIPDALGQAVEFREGEGPVLEPIRSGADVRRLDGAELDKRLSPVFEALARLRVEISDSVTVLGFSGAPWTLALYMVEGRGGTDGGEVRRWAYRDPGGFQGLIDILIEATSGYLVEQVRNGAEAVQVFDSWAGLLGECEFRKWVIEPTVRVVSAFRRECPTTPVIGFPRGAGIMYEAYARETGVDAIGLDNTVPVAWAAERLQSVCTVQGNLDNQLLVVGGPAMDREAERIIDGFSSGPMVFNLGHGVLPETPPANVARLVDLVKSRSGN